jgi:dolichyl-diphosphooligosaccharide--protein glycosyltransferase
VKVFERVPGATIEGEGPENATVQAGVRMRVPASNTSFIYSQRVQTGPDGEFTMTVPYSTTGYDEYTTEEGYTNPEVRAVGPYSFRTGISTNESGYAYRFGGSTNVTEGQVIGEDDSPATVTLERQVLAGPPEPENGTNGNETSDAPSDDQTSGDSTGSDTSTPTPTPTDGSSDETTTPTATPAQSVGSQSRRGPGLLGLAGLVGLPLAGVLAARRR